MATPRAAHLAALLSCFVDADARHSVARLKSHSGRFPNCPFVTALAAHGVPHGGSHLRVSEHPLQPLRLQSFQENVLQHRHRRKRSYLVASQNGSEPTILAGADFTHQQSQGQKPAPSFSPPSVYTVLKISACLALALTAMRGIFGLLVSVIIAAAPPLLTYGGMALVFWPWPAAIVLGVLAIGLAARRGAARQAMAGARSVGSIWEQLCVLFGALTWLILVPCGHFQGYLANWPLLLFSSYALFFAESAFVRGWLYGDLTPRAQDKQWSTPTSRLAQVGFVGALVLGHWLAAWESVKRAGPSGGSWLAVTLLVAALWLHWDATLILGKYFDRVVVPSQVVVAGPYRWVRHPIYTSYMLLFCSYCAALRSYWSLALVLVSCLAYYNVRTQLEESQLLDYFGDEYGAYRKRVDKKYLPLIF